MSGAIARPSLNSMLMLLPLALFLSLWIGQSLFPVSSTQDSTSPAHEQAAQISEYVREVFQDRDGVFWFGTNGDGLARYDGNSLTYLSVEQGFGGRAVRGILQDERGAMWFATDGGVSRYESGVFTNYTEEHGLSDNSVWSLMRDSAGTIWAGTHRGVCRFDGEAFVPFLLPRVEVEKAAPRFTPKVVFAMFEDRNGDLWFGTDGEGVHRYNVHSAQGSVGSEGPALPFTTFTTKDGLAGNLVRSIHGDRQGRIWIGTDGDGVSCYDGTSFRTFTEKDGLNNDRIFEILEDSAGNMWFSTLGAGACRYDGETFTAFGVDQGLNINENPCPCGSGKRFGDCHGPGGGHVQEILEDRDGNLWFGCSGGLYRLDGDSFVNVTREGPWPAAQAASPLAKFERLVSGEWQMILASGSTMFARWNWGPGQHSIQRVTDGQGGDGEPWRSLRVVYRRPGESQLRVFGLSTYARGVTEGTLEFDGETMNSKFDIHQAGGIRRDMAGHLRFDGPDRLRDALLEADGIGGFTTLVDLEYVRSPLRDETRTHTAEETPRPSAYLKPFESLLGKTYEAEVEVAALPDARIQSTFEWIPFADYIHVRTLALAKDAESTELFDSYVYHHTETGKLRCLALSNSGGVYEGDVIVREGGGLQLDLEGFEVGQVLSYVVRFDFERDGTLRQRVWSVDGGERTLLMDVPHKSVEPQPH